MLICIGRIGIGIGGEYPAGSVAAAEATGEIQKGTRNRWFIFFTNLMIDLGFVVSAFVPLVFLWILGDDLHSLRANWRISLGFGIIPPFLLFFLRARLHEPEQTKKNTMKRVKTPYSLVIKYYWKRLLVVSAIWFIYDVNSPSLHPKSTRQLMVKLVLRLFSRHLLLFYPHIRHPRPVPL